MTSKKINIVTLVILILLAIGGVMAFTKQSNAPGLTTESKKTDATTQTTASQPAGFSKTTHSVDDTTSIWVVVNKQRPLSPLKYAPDDLVAVGGGQSLRQAASTAFTAMQTDAKAQKLSLTPMSGYRSYATQVSVYNAEVKAHGQAKADSQSARPGTSEHQTGWALDIGGGGCGIEDCFGITAEGKWVAAHAYKYGFIVRYQADKQGITGYRAEPWHIRYVGVELSTEMHNQGVITLEEFFDLPAAPDYN